MVSRIRLQFNSRPPNSALSTEAVPFKADVRRVLRLLGVVSGQCLNLNKAPTEAVRERVESANRSLIIFPTRRLVRTLHML